MNGITKQIFNNMFPIELLTVRLEQLHGKHYDAIVVNGSGQIKYETGKLLLLFKVNNQEHTKKQLESLWQRSFKGEIHDDSYQFRLIAYGVDNTHYNSDYVFLHNCDSEIVVVQLKELKFQNPTNNKDLAKILLIGHYELPFNEWVSHGSGSKLTCFVCDCGNNISAKFMQNDDFMEIYLYTDNVSIVWDLDGITSFCNRIIEAFSILQAQYTQQCYRQINLNKIAYSSLHSIDNFVDTSFNSMPPPLKANIFGDEESVITFIKLYLNRFPEAWNEYYLLWYKVNAVSTKYPEILSLVLTASIEGVINSFFSDTETNLNITYESKSEAKQLLKTLSNKSMKDKLLHTISNSHKNSIGTRLKNILANKINRKMANDLSQSWTELRNDCAHANKIDLRIINVLKNHTKLQKKSFLILYLLLFILIDYDKSFFDYSSNYYPDKKLADMKK